MNHYVNIMEDLDGKSDIATDEELLLFSETESEMEERPTDAYTASGGCPIELKKSKKKPNV